MRPSGSTAVASVSTSAAPPGAAAEVHEVPVVREAVDALYWHIGDTPIRLRSVTPRSGKGESSIPKGRGSG